MTEELIFMTSNTENTGNVTPLLHQIRHALSQLIERQEDTTIAVSYTHLTLPTSR